MIMRRFLGGLLLFSCLWPVKATVSIGYNPTTGRWELTNGVMRAVYEFSGSGQFGLRELSASGVTWTAPETRASSPISFALNGRFYTADTPFRLEQQFIQEIEGGRRLVVVLADLPSTVQVRIELEMFDGHPVLRHRVAIRNPSSAPVLATAADLLPYRLAVAEAGDLEVAHVDQWDPDNANSFRLQQAALGTSRPPLILRTGADAQDVAWFALRAASQKGLFAGLEFDGRAQVSLQRPTSDGSLRLSASILGLYHPIPPGETFSLPASFLGLFEGDWDQAGHLTQSFTEAVLALPAPEGFPWISWDSWGYGEDLDELVLRESARQAATLGVELFVLDLGWARAIGDWQEDPAKFPGGLRALSDYVHGLGMRFGLHFTPAQAMEDSPVLLAHPDWASSEHDNYFWSSSLCLANRETREWVVAEAVRIIDAYNVDYIVQDGENMVKRCRRSSHSHHPWDSNYSNAVDGINWVVREVQRLRPHVLWENCEDGGQMQTFQMVQQYVTSIANDGTGALDSRRGVWGATYPFSPRYAARYMPEDPSSSYITRSYMFGGPWHLMNRLTELPASQRTLAGREIAIYKSIRGLTRTGRVFHLSEQPREAGVDAIQAYDAGSDQAVIVVTRNRGSENRVTIRPQGLRPESAYTVRFENVPRVEVASGRQLAETGLSVFLPAAQSAEIVYVGPGR